MNRSLDALAGWLAAHARPVLDAAVETFAERRTRPSPVPNATVAAMYDEVLAACRAALARVPPPPCTLASDDAAASYASAAADPEFVRELVETDQAFDVAVGDGLGPAEFFQRHAVDLRRRALEWIISDDTGRASVTIWQVMMGVDPRGQDHPGEYPYDPDDFGRCYRLLGLIPEWRDRLPEIAAAHPWGWAVLVPAWAELTGLYETEAPNHRGSAPRLYERMKELLATQDRSIREGESCECGAPAVGRWGNGSPGCAGCLAYGER